MIKTKSGRVSKTQLMHIGMALLQGCNVSLFQTFGLEPGTALGISSLLGVLQSGMGAYLRTITDEAM